MMEGTLPREGGRPKASTAPGHILELEPPLSSRGGELARARKEVFGRQAGLAHQLARLGMPPLVDWNAAQSAQMGDTAPGWQQPRGRRNPILQHERRLKARMARGAPPGSLPSTTVTTGLAIVAAPIRDALGSFAPAIGAGHVRRITARLAAVGGAQSVLIEAMPVLLRHGHRRREPQAADRLPDAHETLGGNLQGMPGFLRPPPPPKKPADKRAPGTPSSPKLQALASALATLHASGEGLAVTAPVSLDSSPARERGQPRGAQHASVGDAPTAQRVLSPYPSTNDLDEVTLFAQPDGGKQGGVRTVVLYPCVQGRPKVPDFRGLPLQPAHYRQELAADAARLLNLDSYMAPNVAPANESVHAPHGWQHVVVAPRRVDGAGVATRESKRPINPDQPEGRDGMYSIQVLCQTSEVVAQTEAEQEERQQQQQQQREQRGEEEQQEEENGLARFLDVSGSEASVADDGEHGGVWHDLLLLRESSGSWGVASCDADAAGVPLDAAAAAAADPASKSARTKQRRHACSSAGAICAEAADGGDDYDNDADSSGSWGIV